MSIANSYELFQSGPQINTVVETAENTFYVYQHPLNVFMGGLLDGASRDSGNTVTDVLRPGLLLGRVFSTGKLKEWSPTATDGTQYLFGILDNPGVKMQANATNKDRFRGTIMVRGLVDPTRLLVPGGASYSIVGNANEYLIRSQLLRLGFYLQEDPSTTSLFRTSGFMGDFTQISAKTADYTVSAYESGTLFTTRGAGGAVNFTLPATAAKGLVFSFFNAANQNMTVTAGTADTMTVFNDLTADSVAFSTASAKVGGMITVIGDGTGWLTIVNVGQASDGTATGQVVTIAT